MGWLKLAFFMLLCSIALPALEAQAAVAIDFDAVDATHGRVVAIGYLARFGVTLEDVTPGTLVVIDNARNFYEGRALAASSPPNVLTQINSNDPVEFTLRFDKPARSVEFTRPALLAGPTGITFPEWKAEALDADGNVLDQAGEPLGSGTAYYSNVPAKKFSLQGQGISALRFSSNNMHFAAFSAVVIDDLVLYLQADE
jgi:hypothetical protein